MENKLSLVMITENVEEFLPKTLNSIRGLVDEIIIVDNCSKDSTVSIAKARGAKVYIRYEYDLGKQRKFALSKASCNWILILDGDEAVTKPLKSEIRKVLKKPKYLGYMVPFQNHFLGKKIFRGGEGYSMLRLFRKDAVIIESAYVHEAYTMGKNKVGKLKNKILHYSYRSIPKMYSKFHNYAIREARQKYIKGEKSSLKKLILYPIHMFWARFIKDKGYRDGLFRIPLDLGFAYMELVTYVALLIYCLKPRGFEPSKPSGLEN